MKGIIKVEDLPEQEKIYLKESFDGWRVVNPNRNEDGTLNWKNIISGGNWWKLFAIAIVVLVILGVLYEYSDNMKTYHECFDDEIKLNICKQSINPEVWGTSETIFNPLGELELPR